MSDKWRKMLTDYTTIGLVIGLSWRDARKIAREIVRDKKRGRRILGRTTQN